MSHMSADTALPIVDIRGVSKVYRLQDQTIHALSGANLSIRKGEFVCLIGASGCGKSTLLRIMAGFEQPSAGEALMWGKPIDGPDPSRGMVFQDYALFPWLSVRDNIGFGPAARGLSSGEGRDTRQYLDRFNGEVERLMAGVAALDVPLVVEAGVGPNWDKAH